MLQNVCCFEAWYVDRSQINQKITTIFAEWRIENLKIKYSHECRMIYFMGNTIDKTKEVYLPIFGKKLNFKEIKQIILTIDPNKTCNG